ncbi:MAG: PAS domain-containing protein [Candidatus Altiarchaeota archaeon]
MDVGIQALLEAARARLWSADFIIDASDLRVVWAGDRVREELGYASEDLVGVNLSEFVVLDGPQVKGILFSLLSREQTLVVTAMKKDGRPVKLRVRVESLEHDRKRYVLVKVI